MGDSGSSSSQPLLLVVLPLLALSSLLLPAAEQPALREDWEDWLLPADKSFLAFLTTKQRLSHYSFRTKATKKNLKVFLDGTVTYFGTVFESFFSCC